MKFIFSKVEAVNKNTSKKSSVGKCFETRTSDVAEMREEEKDTLGGQRL